jgi:hypothetical protein
VVKVRIQTSHRPAKTTLFVIASHTLEPSTATGDFNLLSLIQLTDSLSPFLWLVDELVLTKMSTKVASLKIILLQFVSRRLFLFYTTEAGFFLLELKFLHHM